MKQPHTGTMEGLAGLAADLREPEWILGLGGGMGLLFFIVTQILHAKRAPHPWLTNDKLPKTRERVRQYGNAVTPPVAEVIVSALVEAITGEDLDRYPAAA